MAIGYRSGYLRKKIGDMVMFVNQNVNGKVKQVARAYTAEVKNPKTARQSNQRSLFVAAKNFRRGFESLLNHSWQGKKYGVQSLNRFSQLVLANKGANYPGFFLQPKNSMKFIPQPWPVATGSIIGINAHYIDGSLFSGLRWIDGQKDTTWGDVSQIILNANPGLREGDMITVLAVVTNDLDVKTTSTFLPLYDRIIIDTTSTTPITDDGDMRMEGGVLDLNWEDTNLATEISVTTRTNGSYNRIVGCAVIISRLNEAGTGYLRSNSVMAIRSDIADLFNDTEYVNNCIATFMNESMLTSDWYLNQVGQDTSNPQGGGGGVANSYEQGSVTLANSSTLANALIATIGGVRKPVASGTGASKACVKYADGGWQYTPAADLLPAATEAWTIEEFSAAFPEVTITLVENP